jgi:RNA polymerase sigma-70 factor (ECF subfamily)
VSVLTLQPGPFSSAWTSFAPLAVWARWGERVVGCAPLVDPVVAPMVKSEADDTAADAAMDRYADGEDAAFRTVHAALVERLRAFLLRMAKSPALADDLVQETFLRMHRARGSFKRGAKVVPWSYAIARNVYIDQTRMLGVKREKLATTDEDPNLGVDAGPGANAEELSVANDLARTVEKTLAALPVNQREAFVLLRYEGLSVADAAEILGATEGAVKLRAFHAYEALRSALGVQDRKRGATLSKTVQPKPGSRSE